VALEEHQAGRAWKSTRLAALIRAYGELALTREYGCLWLALAGSGWLWLALGGSGWLWVALEEHQAGSGWLWVALAGSGWVALAGAKTAPPLGLRFTFLCFSMVFTHVCIIDLWFSMVFLAVYSCSMVFH
jgi:hypothetical protein